MSICDFLDQIKNLSCVMNVNYDNENVEIFFDNGTRSKFTFDEWFDVVDVALNVISINKDLCREKYQD